MKTRNSCREWRELLGAYALGHLEGDERAGLEAHLEGCAGCREELAALQPVALMLPHADPARFELTPEPPPELGRRIAATIEAEKQRTQQRRRRRTLGGFAFGGAAAAAVAAVLILFVFGGSSQDASQPVRFTDLPEGVSISATLEPHAYGTEIHMYVHGVPSGTLCRVWLKGPKGASYPAGTFRYRWGDDSDAVLSSALDISRTRELVVDTGKRTFVAPVRPPGATATIRQEEAT
ncbi:MAG TPA: zf-HC2 domain-containing protein [Solirubrobacterales bacterium]|nr:zf-HC2 domain-containing protein [Solirubrobacterales bacterium]